MNKKTFLQLWSMGAGGMDFATGVLLLAIPHTVLRLLGITTPSADALVFLSWIGVFVMAVGLSYGLAFGNRGRGETVWMITGMVRLLVGAFLVVRVTWFSMEPAWLLVAGADLAVAAVQGFVLSAGWWKEVHP